MAGYEAPRPPTPTVLCRLCGEGIWKVAELVVEDGRAAHVVCLERHAVDPLTGDERTRLICTCCDHEVAFCGVCSRKYRITEMGTDLFTERHNLCPFCRLDLTWSIRQHIASCPVVRQNDPAWQATVRDALAHARETRKASQQLRDTSEVTRVTSEVLLSRTREAAEAAASATGRRTCQEVRAANRKVER